MSTETKERAEEMPAWLASDLRRTLGQGYHDAMFLTHRSPLAGLLRAWSYTVDAYARQIADNVAAGEDPSAWLPAYRLATARRHHHGARLSARVDATKAAQRMRANLVNEEGFTESEAAAIVDACLPTAGVGGADQ